MKPIFTASAVLLFASALVAQGGASDATADASRKGDGDQVTFTEHVAPIIFQNCTSCHRPGEVGPFPLTNYKETRKRGRMIARVTKMRFMPPWHPVKGHGEFADTPRMSKKDIDTLQRWVKSGMAEGDPKKLPKMPEFPKGWQLGEPDMVVKMDKPFRVPAGGRDIYKNFLIELNLREDKWVTAIEVRPSARSVLHHTLFRVTGGRSTGRGFGLSRGRTRGQLGTSTSGLGGWAVGGQARHLPLGLAVKIPKGNNLILSSHFHPSGKEEYEQTTLGLHFTDRPPKRTMVGIQLPPVFGASAGIDIPAGKSAFTIKESFTLPVDIQGLTIGGHAHYICKEMQMWATLPNGKRKSIFWIDNWAFNWQNRYQYKEPIDLPKGTKIEAQLIYDNSEQNPNNPFDPPRRIRWGLQSTDEMGSLTLLAVCKNEQDVPELKRALRRQRDDGLVRAAADRMIRRMDRNRNGRLEQDEISSRFGRAFLRFDKNNDGELDEKEIEELKKNGGSLLGGGRRRRR